MNLGNGLFLQTKGGGISDPATFAIEGWWRGSYSASPWSGVTSAGGSSGRTMTEATNPPSAGTAVNTFTPADFDGVNDKLTAGSTAGTYITTTLHSGWALVNVDVIDTSNAVAVLNDSILSVTTGYFSIYLKSTGVVGFAHGTQAGPTVSVETPINTAGYHLVHWRLTGGFLQIGVDGVWGPTVAGDMHTTGLAQSLKLGANANDTQFFDGRILDVALSKVDVFAGNGLASVLAYVQTRYGIDVTAFNPGKLASVAHWYRADFGIDQSTTLGFVKQWNDLVGTAHLIQATGANQPAYNTTDAAYGNQATLQTSSLTQWLSASGVTTAAPYSIWLIGETATDNDIMFTLSAGAAQPFIGRLTNQARIYTGTNLSSVVNWTTKAAVLTSCTSAPTRFIGVNNWISGGVSDTSAIVGGTSVGAFATLGGSFGNVGKIAEIIIQGAVPSASEKSSMAAYLTARYGITIT